MNDLDFSFHSDEDIESTFYKLMTLVADLQEKLSISQSVNIELASQLELVQQELRLLRAKPFIGKNEHVSADQLLLFSKTTLLDPLVEEGSKKDEEAKKGKPSRLSKRARLTRNERLQNLSVRKVILPIPEGDQICPCCSKQKTLIGVEISRQLEFIPSSLFVIEYHRQKVSCKSCSEFVTIAPVAPKVIKRGLPGCGLVAYVAVSKYADHLPLSRQENIFIRMGSPVSRSTMCDWLKLAADKLQRLVNLIKKKVLESSIIWTDDTTVKLKETVSNAAGKKLVESRMWTYRGDMLHPYIFYDHTRSRKRDGPKKVLTGFTGILQADAYAGYNCIYASGEVLEAACLAHVRRKFYESILSSGLVALTALSLIDGMYHIEHEAEDRAAREHLTTEEFFSLRLAMRKEKSSEKMLQFKKWLDVNEKIQLPQSAIAKAIQYTQNNWEALNTIFVNGEVTLDNNFAEGALRRIALGRKNYLFFGSENGGKTAAIFYTLIASASRNGIEPFEYLRDVLHCLTTNPDIDLSELLPDVWRPTFNAKKLYGEDQELDLVS